MRGALYMVLVILVVLAAIAIWLIWSSLVIDLRLSNL
jgi:hypothetical protein